RRVRYHDQIGWRNTTSCFASKKNLRTLPAILVATPSTTCAKSVYRLPGETLGGPYRDRYHALGFHCFGRPHRHHPVPTMVGQRRLDARSYIARRYRPAKGSKRSLARAQ